MSIVNILLIILWGIIVPFILGYQLDLFVSKDKISYGMSLIFGYIIYCATFELVAPWFIVNRAKFTSLYNTWIVIISVLFVAIVVLNIKSMGARLMAPINDIKCKIRNYKNENYDWLTLLLFIGSIAVILIHTLLMGYFMHFDTDDARFVAEAMESYERNTLLAYHPITGEFTGVPIGEMTKDVFAPFPIFMAAVGKMFMLPPAIAFHTVIPFFFIPFCYIIFANVAKYFFKDDKKSIAVAVFLFGIVNTFSMETVFSFGWTLLAIVWQGRSMLCVVIIPTLWYILIRFIVEDEIKWTDYFLMGITALSGCMVSGMGALLAPLMICAHAVMVFVKKKNIKVIIYMMIAMIPTLIFFYLYSVGTNKF